MAGRTITSWGQLFGEFQISHGVTGIPPAPPVPVPDDGDAAFLFTSSGPRARDEEDDGPNPWDRLKKWLVRANESEIENKRVARLLNVDESDRDMMRLASKVRRKRRRS